MEPFQQQALTLLADRRKGEAALGDNPVGPAQAVRWQTASTLDDLFWERVEGALAAGAFSADKPIELSAEDACLTNFGITFDLVQADLIRRQAETEGAPATDVSTNRHPHLIRCLGRLEMAYSELHASTGVYNLEPWIQEMYRDCLDADHLDDLAERTRLLEEEIRGTPSRLGALGIPPPLVRELVQSFQRFQHVQNTGLAHAKGSSDILHARDYAAIAGKFEAVVERAKPYATVPMGDGAGLPEVLERWKKTTLDVLAIRQEVEAIHALPTQERIADLLQMLETVRTTLARGAEESRQPPCSLIDSAQAEQVCPRQTIDDEFAGLLMHDPIGRGDVTADRLEQRKFGPMSVLVLPGAGRARYSTELRDFQTTRLKNARSKDTERRGYDLDRRTNYPLNCIVVPGSIPPEEALEQLADAFLEYKAIAYAPAYNAFLNEARTRFPKLQSRDAVEEGVKHPFRRRLATYIAGFVRWARHGRVADLPDMQAFIDWAQARVDRPELLVLPRYRCAMQDFADATPERRETRFRRLMRDRYTVDRVALSLATLGENIEEMMNAARFLSAETRSNRYFRQAVEASRSEGRASHESTISEFRRFIMSDTDLNRVFLETEAQVFSEMDLLRNHAAEKLGKSISRDDAMHAVLKRRAALLAGRRDRANTRIDRNLLGLLYSVEGNHTAARAELAAYVDRMEEQRDLRRQTPVRYNGDMLRETLGHRATRDLTLEDAGRVLFEDDFVYFNLGSLALKADDTRAASDWFSRFCLWAAQTHWRLFGEITREMNESLENSAR